MYYLLFLKIEGGIAKLFIAQSLFMRSFFGPSLN